MNTPVPIKLSDQYLANMIANPAVRREFPFFDSAQQNMKSAMGCGKCGARNKEYAMTFQRVRDFVLSMPDGQLKKLKAILGISSRQFVSYGGRLNLQKIVR
jgi:hypothetical protein